MIRITRRPVTKERSLRRAAWWLQSQGSHSFRGLQAVRFWMIRRVEIVSGKQSTLLKGRQQFWNQRQLDGHHQRSRGRAARHRQMRHSQGIQARRTGIGQQLPWPTYA